MIHARRVVAEFDALHAAMRQYTSSFSGNIVVGTMPIMARQGLAACIANFNRKHPKVRIEISEGKTKELVKRLHYGEIDVAFVVLDKIEDRTITLHPLIQDELILVVDELNPLAKKRSIDLAEAANENFIFPTQRSSMFELGMRACEASGFTPKIAYQCGEIDMINHLVAERLGVSIMARKVALASALPNTVILSLKTKIERVTSLAVSSAEAPSSTVRLFIDHVLQEKF
jgi:DNA-binding transcriptional LysR family regulator